MNQKSFLHALALAAAGLLALCSATACGDDSAEGRPSSSSSSSSGGSGGSDPCGDPPLDCIGGEFQTDANGCLICVYDDPTSSGGHGGSGGSGGALGGAGGLGGSGGNGGDGGS